MKKFLLLTLIPFYIQAMSHKESSSRVVEQLQKILLLQTRCSGRATGNITLSNIVQYLSATVVQHGTQTRYDLALTSATLDELIKKEQCASYNAYLSDKLVPEIRTLTISGNRIRAISPVKGHTLSAGLNIIPDELTDLPHLTTLNLHQNGIRSLCVPRLLQLKILDLSENELEEVPELHHNNLPVLTELNLRSNRLKTLPVELVGLCQQLTSLKLRHNPIEQLPSEYAQVAKILDLPLVSN